MHCVTKAILMHFINSKSHIKKLKSRRTAFQLLRVPFSCELLLTPSGTDTHTHTNFRNKSNPYRSSVNLV